MYLDGTEEPPDRSEPPSFCPLCKGPLITKWSAGVQHRRRRGFFAVAVPAHTCETCQVTVRVCTLPRKKLYATRKAARTSVSKDLASKNEARASARPEVP